MDQLGREIQRLQRTRVRDRILALVALLVICAMLVWLVREYRATKSDGRAITLAQCELSQIELLNTEGYWYQPALACFALRWGGAEYLAPRWRVFDPGPEQIKWLEDDFYRLIPWYYFQCGRQPLSTAEDKAACRLAFYRGFKFALATNPAAMPWSLRDYLELQRHTCTPLHLALDQGDSELVQELLALGWDQALDSEHVCSVFSDEHALPLNYELPARHDNRLGTLLARF